MIVIKYDPNTNRVLNAQKSGEASPGPDTLVFHDQNSTREIINILFVLIDTVPVKYMKVVGGDVLEMTQEEKDAIDAAELVVETANIRISAKESVVGFSPNPLFQRAFADIIKDEFNLLRQWTRDFKTEVAAATNLANLQTRVASLPTLNDRTLAQLKTAIQNRIDDTTVDSD